MTLGSRKSSSCWIAIFVVLPLCFLIACQRHNSKAEQTVNESPAVGEAKFSPGLIAPEFEFLDLNGEKKTLHDFRGKHVLLNFWATWCAPCVSEMGALERLYKTYKDQGFEIVAINVDPAENLDAVKTFVKENGITFTILRDPELSLPPVYGLTGFPESFFISNEGKFLNFSDPSVGTAGVRIVGDRPWDSETFLKSVREVLPKS